MDPFSDDKVKRIIRKFNKGVRGVIICDSSGLPIDSNMDIEISEEVAAYVTSLIGKGRQVVDALNEGTLKFIRLEASKGETMVALEGNLIFIFLKGKTPMTDQDDGDHEFTTPFPPIPPSSPSPTGGAKQKLQLRVIEKESEYEPYCKHCGAELPKGQSICHVCGKKVI